MRVQHILKAKGEKVVTVGPGASVGEVARTLKTEGIGAVVVTGDGESVAGIVSERDIVRALVEHGRDLLEKPVSEVMTSQVVTCAPDDRLDDIRRTMTERRVRHLPVLKKWRLAGIISIGDVVKSRLEELEAESSQLRDYISGG